MTSLSRSIFWPAPNRDRTPPAVRFAIIAGCVLAGALGTSCGDIHVVPADGGAGKSGGDGGRGGGAAGSAAGTAGTGPAGAADGRRARAAGVADGGPGRSRHGGAGSAGAAERDAGTGGGGRGGGAGTRGRGWNGSGAARAAAGEGRLSPRALDQRRLRPGRELVERSAAGHTVGAQVRRCRGREPPGHATIRPLRPATRRAQQQQLRRPLRRAVRQHSDWRARDHHLRAVADPDRRAARTISTTRPTFSCSTNRLPASPFFRSAPRWSNLTQASTWTPFSFAVNVASVAGKQMVFRIVADLDTSVPTYFYFDTLSVAVTRCSP